jgi:hypothetical protein
MLRNGLVTILTVVLLLLFHGSPASAYPFEALFQRSPISYSIANNGGNLDSTCTTFTVTETQAVTLTATVVETVSVTITQSPSTVTATVTSTETESPLTTSTFDNGLWDPAKYITVYFTTSVEASITTTVVQEAEATLPAR